MLDALSTIYCNSPTHNLTEYEAKIIDLDECSPFSYRNKR